jgi:hypothetical protein
MRLAQLVSLIVFGLAGLFLIAPWLKRRGRAHALIALLAVHVFRVVVLFEVQAQHNGYPISNTAVTEIVVGDLLGAAMAVVAILLLRARSSFGVILAWLVILETIVDIAVGVHRRIIEPLHADVAGIMWAILVFFVPLMLVTLPLLAWQLIVRRKEPLI